MVNADISICMYMWAGVYLTRIYISQCTGKYLSIMCACECMYKNLNLNKISGKKYEYRQKENFPLMDLIKAKDSTLQHAFIKRNFYFCL